ncbi:MAG: hypothetical protein ACR2PO_02280 [Methyloligellaceae bacterium]
MGLLSQFRQKQIDSTDAALRRHDRIFRQFLEQVDAATWLHRTDRCITILARSPASPVVHAFVRRTEDLKLRNIGARIILARLEPESHLHDMTTALSTLIDDDDVGEFVRWASNSCILDAHEQLILGSTMCWSGDTMRREPGKRDSLDLFERDAPGTVRLGVLAFDAIWSAAVQVPASRLSPGTTAKPVAALARQSGGALPKPQFLLGSGGPAVTRH